MSIRLWRRKRIAPGLRVNLSLSGVSLSAGRPGMWATVGRRGRTVTFGAPGTGLRWTEYHPHRKSENAPHGPSEAGQTRGETIGLIFLHGFIGALAIMTAIVVIGLASSFVWK